MSSPSRSSSSRPSSPKPSLDLSLPPATADADYAKHPEQQPFSLQPLREVAAPSLIFAGVQLAWAVQIGHATAHLRKLGLSDKLVGLAWLAGPVTGILVQPIVGVLSDRCTSRFGRRRPFMLGGAFAVAWTLVLFAHAGEVARILGDPLAVTGGGSKTALWLAVAAFWVLDLSVNLLQAPTRALLGDAIPPAQLPVGNAFFAVANGFGKAVGYACGAFAADFQTVSALAAVGVITLSFVPALLITEKPISETEATAPNTLDENPSERRSVGGELRHMARETGSALRALPKAIQQVFVVQWFTYLSFMIMFIYLSDWVGLEVTGGDADAPPSSAAHARFSAGVVLANKGLLAMSILSMLLSPAVPMLARVIGTRLLWSTSLAVLGCALIGTLLRPNEIGALFIAICIAFPLSTAFTIPWAIACLALRGPLAQQRGLYLAIFNLSQATPGVVASLTGGLIVHFARGRLAIVLATAGVAAIFGAVAVIFVEVPKEMASLEKDLRSPRKRQKGKNAKCTGCFPSDVPANARTSFT